MMEPMRRERQDMCDARLDWVLYVRITVNDSLDDYRWKYLELYVG